VAGGLGGLPLGSGSLGAVASEMSPQQAAELLRSGEAQLVDVREPYEHEAGRIEGSLHIELERLPGEAAALDRGRPILFYCRSGSRSALAADAFAASGYDAHNLDGGLQAWVGAGLPIEPSDGRVA
jgi:rhodanese-related sulfurtransferase